MLPGNRAEEKIKGRGKRREGEKEKNLTEEYTVIELRS